jgi:hypothetical protein
MDDAVVNGSLLSLLRVGMFHGLIPTLNLA